MSAADRVVPRLEKARSVGKSEWVACCPAHADKSPSLAVRETDDGRLLVHCFAGCSAVEVMAALGLTVGDLWDEPLAHHQRSIRHPFSPGAVLRAISGEALIVAIAGNDALQGTLAADDRERMVKAVARINEAVRYA